MSEAPFEQAGSLRIGAVDFVSPDEIKVALDIEAPESVALNTGGPRPFPRVNGYLLVPVTTDSSSARRSGSRSNAHRFRSGAGCRTSASWICHTHCAGCASIRSVPCERQRKRERTRSAEAQTPCHPSAPQSSCRPKRSSAR